MQQKEQKQNAGKVATVAAGHDPGELQTMKVDRQLWSADR